MRYFILGLIFLGIATFKAFAHQKPLLVASIYPLAEIAREVGAEAIDVHLLLPPGADPHTWEPTPRDLILLRKADLLFVVGGGLEPWLEDLLKGVKRPPLILSALENASEKDPHVWLDFPKDASLCLRLAKILGQIEPSKAEYFEKKGKEAADKFLKLHRSFKTGLKNCRHRVVPLAGHDAFRAWAKNYDLKFITLAGLSPEAEPSPKALKKLISIIKKEGLSAVFYDEPASKAFAEMIARETGAAIYYLTPAASPTREELKAHLSFWDFMKEDLKRLRQGLSCP